MGRARVGRKPGGKQSKSSNTVKKKPCINKSTKQRVKKKILGNKLKDQRRAENGTLKPDFTNATSKGDDNAAGETPGKKKKLSLHEKIVLHQAQQLKAAEEAGIVLDTCGTAGKATAVDTVEEEEDEEEGEEDNCPQLV